MCCVRPTSQRAGVLQPPPAALRSSPLQGFVAQIIWRLSFPLPRTDLRHRHGHRCAELGEAVEQCCPYLKLCHLAIKVTRHDAFAQEFQAAHVGFDQATPVVAAPLFPDRSPKPLGGFHDFISRFCPRRKFLPQASILARRDDARNYGHICQEHLVKARNKATEITKFNYLGYA